MHHTTVNWAANFKKEKKKRKTFSFHFTNPFMQILKAKLKVFQKLCRIKSKLNGGKERKNLGFLVAFAQSF